MQRIDPVVRKETKYIAVGVLLLSTLMQAVFLIIGSWGVPVLLGNVLGALAAVGNFFAMALTVQRAVTEDEKQAKQTVKLSNALRMLIMFALLAAGVLLPVFDVWTTVIPVTFPRLIVAVRPLLDRARRKGEGSHEG